MWLCMWKLTISEEILIWFLDYFNILALCEQLWKIRILGPLLRQKGSPLGPLFAKKWVPFLQFLGPLVIEEQCIPHPLHLAPCCLSIDSLPWPEPMHKLHFSSLLFSPSSCRSVSSSTWTEMYFLALSLLILRPWLLLPLLSSLLTPAPSLLATLPVE